MSLKNILSLSVLSLFIGQAVVIAAPSKYSVYASQGIGVSSTSNSSIGGKILVNSSNTADINIRPELTIKDSIVGVGISVTTDKHFGDTTVYSGFGAGTNLIAKDVVKPYAIIGLEHQLNSSYYLFGQAKLPLESVNNSYSPIINIGAGFNI